MAFDIKLFEEYSKTLKSKEFKELEKEAYKLWVDNLLYGLSAFDENFKRLDPAKLDRNKLKQNNYGSSKG